MWNLRIAPTALLVALFSSSVLAQKCPTDLLVVVDNSGSVQDVFNNELEIAAKLVESLDVSPTKTRVAMVQFNQQSEVVFPFNVYAENVAVAGAIRNVTQKGGSTNVVSGLTAANEQFGLARSNVNRLVLMITDGNSQNTLEDISSAVQKLNATGVTIFVSTASDQVSLIEFDLYTSGHRERWFLKNNITSLPSTIGSFISSGSCTPDVIVTKPPVIIETKAPVVVETTQAPAPTTTHAAEPPKPSGCKADVMIIVDNSGSVEGVFADEKDTGARLVESFVVSPLNTRVAMLQFNANAQRVFGFNEYIQSSDVAGAVRNVTQVGGSTNTKSVLDLAATEFSQNARSGVNKVILLITDGNSQNTIEDLTAGVKRLVDDKIVIFAASNSDNIGLLEFNIFTSGHPERFFLKNNLTSLVSTVNKESVGGSDCGPKPTEGPKPTAGPTQGPTQPPQAGCKSDVLIVVDNSGSVENDFTAEKETAAKLVESLNVSPLNNRVALLDFNVKADTIFSFDVYADTVSVAGATRNVSQVGGSTNTKSVLDLALQEFNAKARSGVNKIMLLITDGNSQNTIEDLTSATKALVDANVVIFAASNSDNIGLLEFQIFTQAHSERVFLKGNLTSLVGSVSSVITSGSCVKAGTQPPPPNAYPATAAPGAEGGAAASAAPAAVATTPASAAATTGASAAAASSPAGTTGAAAGAGTTGGAAVAGTTGAPAAAAKFLRKFKH